MAQKKYIVVDNNTTEPIYVRVDVRDRILRVQIGDAAFEKANLLKPDHYFQCLIDSDIRECIDKKGALTYEFFDRCKRKVATPAKPKVTDKGYLFDIQPLWN